MGNEMWWNALLTLIRIDEGPDKFFEHSYLEIGGEPVDTFFDEQVADACEVPDDRFSFRKTPTQGVKYPDALPCVQKLVAPNDINGCKLTDSRLSRYHSSWGPIPRKVDDLGVVSLEILVDPDIISTNPEFRDHDIIEAEVNGVATRDYILMLIPVRSAVPIHAHALVFTLNLVSICIWSRPLGDVLLILKALAPKHRMNPGD
jgi:hypothetical protein